MATERVSAGPRPTGTLRYTSPWTVAGQQQQKQQKQAGRRHQMISSDAFDRRHLSSLARAPRARHAAVYKSSSTTTDHRPSAVKLKFHASSFLAAFTWQMSRGCRRHVTRKSGVSGESDEDATRTLATCSQQVVRVVLVDFGE